MNILPMAAKCPEVRREAEKRRKALSEVRQPGGKAGVAALTNGNQRL